MDEQGIKLETEGFIKTTVLNPDLFHTCTHFDLGGDLGGITRLPYDFGDASFGQDLEGREAFQFCKFLLISCYALWILNMPQFARP